MTNSVTICLSRDQRRQLARKAQATGMTEAELLRELLDRELAADTVGQRAGHTKGRLSFTTSPGNWRNEIRKRNWRS